MDIDDEEVKGNYNDGNRAFLQAFMARGQMTFEEGQKVLAAIFTIQEDKTVTPDEVTQEDFRSYISAAAEALSPLDYEIRSTQDQITKVRVYGIVNSISDLLTQMATTRTTEEMFYLKRILDGMFETFNTRRREVTAITSMQAMEKRFLKGGNRQDEGEVVDKGLTGSEAERFLQSLVDEMWLVRSGEGFYRLSTRGLMELRSWLIETYNEEGEEGGEWQRIKFCEACKDIVTVGQRCAELGCNVRLHHICEVGYWNSRAEKKCPRCETDWGGENYVGEQCVLATEEHLRGKRRSGISQRSRVDDNVEEGNGQRRSRRTEREEEEEDGEGQEDE